MMQVTGMKFSKKNFTYIFAPNWIIFSTEGRLGNFSKNLRKIKIDKCDLNL